MRILHTGAALRAVMLAGLLAGLSGAAYAQTSTDTTSPTGKKTPELPVAPAPAEGQQVVRPPPPPPTDPVASALAPVTDFGQTLKTHGVYLQLGYLENFLANVSGGRETGMYPDGELYLGTVLDLQTIAGIPEASFHITFDERNGPNVNRAAGTQGPLSANHGPTNVMRLSEFYWEQGFAKDRVDIIVGRTNPTADFATSLIACNYVSSIICAQPGSWYFSNNNPAYPAASGADASTLRLRRTSISAPLSTPTRWVSSTITSTGLTGSTSRKLPAYSCPLRSATPLTSPARGILRGTT